MPGVRVPSSPTSEGQERCGFLAFFSSGCVGFPSRLFTLLFTSVTLSRTAPKSLPSWSTLLLVAARDAEVVLMHRRGLPENTFAGPAYSDVVEEVRAFLLERAAVCEAGGVKRERITLDPGIGFGKSIAQEFELIAGAGRLGDAGYPVLIGCSRKSPRRKSGSTAARRISIRRGGSSCS